MQCERCGQEIQYETNLRKHSNPEQCVEVLRARTTELESEIELGKRYAPILRTTIRDLESRLTAVIEARARANALAERYTEALEKIAAKPCAWAQLYPNMCERSERHGIHAGPCEACIARAVIAANSPSIAKTSAQSGTSSP